MRVIAYKSSVSSNSACAIVTGFNQTPVLMLPSQITRLRLVNQQLAKPRFVTARDLVAWMGAIQAQEYAMARWAIGLRVPALNDAAVESAFNRGEILRTHVLRPTWHFVAPEDIRWMVALAAPQINAISAYMLRQLELNEKIFKRSNTILAKSLAGGRHLTRTILQARLHQGKIIAEGPRLSYLMMRAEIDGIICSGPRLGKQFTYALLDERVQSVATISREKALARLAEKFFRSRGPATVHDFAYWSGLSLKDSRNGAASLPVDFTSEDCSGKEYFHASTPSRNSRIGPTFLMPEYDEYGMSYKDLGTMWSTRPQASDQMAGKNARHQCLVIEGEFCGWWQRDSKSRRPVIDPNFLASLTKSRRAAVTQAVEKYNSFIVSTDSQTE